jgi:hypothetical protein
LLDEAALVEFVFAFVASPLRLGLFGFSFRVFRGFIRFGFGLLPDAFDLFAAFGHVFFFAHEIA